MPYKQVLIVDDDKLICWALEREFAGAGHSARSVENGTDALEELGRRTYDLVFLDIHLPDTDGLELLRELERISPGSKIVIMSGDASDANRQRAYNGGAVQFLEKPFDLSEVHDILMSTSGLYTQKRQDPRHICRIPLRISIVAPAPEESSYDLHNLSGLMADVGPGGLRLRTEYPLRVGQKVRAHAAAGEDPVLKLLPQHGTAEVVWVVPAPDGVTAGLKFLS